MIRLRNRPARHPTYNAALSGMRIGGREPHPLPDCDLTAGPIAHRHLRTLSVLSKLLKVMRDDSWTRTVVVLYRSVTGGRHVSRPGSDSAGPLPRHLPALRPAAELAAVRAAQPGGRLRLHDYRGRPRPDRLVDRRDPGPGR